MRPYRDGDGDQGGGGEKEPSSGVKRGQSGAAVQRSSADCYSFEPL